MKTPSGTGKRLALIFSITLFSIMGILMAAEPAMPILGRIPDFTLTERSGKAVRRSDLDGKVWIADFVFTRCAGVCPLMTSRMQGLQEKLRGEPGIRLVSFSVDPDYDTPAVLSAYAQKFHADPEKWVFLTGPETVIFRLSEQHFHLGVSEIPLAERAAADQPVLHSTKFVLVDQAGRIRGYYDSEDAGARDSLLRDAASLLRAG